MRQALWPAKPERHIQPPQRCRRAPLRNDTVEHHDKHQSEHSAGSGDKPGGQSFRESLGTLSCDILRDSIAKGVPRVSTRNIPYTERLHQALTVGNGARRAQAQRLQPRATCRVQATQTCACRAAQATKHDRGSRAGTYTVAQQHNALSLVSSPMICSIADGIFGLPLTPCPSHHVQLRSLAPAPSGPCRSSSCLDHDHRSVESRSNQSFVHAKGHTSRKVSRHNRTVMSCS